MDDATFIFLKRWADDVAWDMIHQSDDLYHSDGKKITSLILESMSPSKEWKKR
jgi:hypothetical protein